MTLARLLHLLTGTLPVRVRYVLPDGVYLNAELQPRQRTLIRCSLAGPTRVETTITATDPGDLLEAIHGGHLHAVFVADDLLVWRDPIDIALRS